jgi:hypothetical protein
MTTNPEIGGRMGEIRFFTILDGKCTGTLPRYNGVSYENNNRRAKEKLLQKV